MKPLKGPTVEQALVVSDNKSRCATTESRYRHLLHDLTYQAEEARTAHGSVLPMAVVWEEAEEIADPGSLGTAQAVAVVVGARSPDRRVEAACFQVLRAWPSC